ncbi:MAG: 6-phosphogluconolactonase [Pseudomonadota bacterium]
MTFQSYPDAEMLMIDLANQVAGDLENALLTHDRVTLAVPGGSTPGPMFDMLAAADLDWQRVDVMLTDERWVPIDHIRSNTRLLKNRLMKDRAVAANLIPFYQGGLDVVQGAAQAAARVADALPIDVLILGMGADMHTASLFPGAPELPAAQSMDAPPVHAMTPGDGLEPRVTLTAPVLAGAMATHILIVGDEKRTAYDRAQDLPFDQAPVGQFLRQAITHWAKD